MHFFRFITSQNYHFLVIILLDISDNLLLEKLVKKIKH